MTKVKICGLSTKEAVETAVDAGADFIGFVFAKSKRQVTPEQAGKLGKLIPKSIKKVGVFVSPTREELQEAITTAKLDMIQIHGDYDEELCASFGLPVIRAIAVKEGFSKVTEKADYYLFDAPVAGSGKTFDWEALAKEDLPTPYFIAGGLTVDNAKTCIDLLQPYALDVSSGVETDGRKDTAKIRAFIGEVKDDLSTT